MLKAPAPWVYPQLLIPVFSTPQFLSLVAGTGDELGRRGGAHFASEKHCMKSSDRGCNYDKQWEEDSCWIHSTSGSTWIMPKLSVWILMCWGLGGWGSVGLLRKEPEHCQSMFFTWLLASLYFLTWKRFSSKISFQTSGRPDSVTPANVILWNTATGEQVWILAAC